MTEMATAFPPEFRLADPPVRDRKRYSQHQKRNGIGSKDQALPPTTALGARLRALRMEAGLNQVQVSVLVGYGTSGGGRVSDWELGHVLPTLPILHRYAQAFDITVSQLLDGVL